MGNKKITIGRTEKVHFPDLDLFEIDAKIDSGAYTSSIHCHDIWENSDESALFFKLLDPSHKDYNEKELKFDNYSKTVVKSSTGIAERRYKIKTKIQIGKKSYTTSFTLTDRAKMKYPVLLGRVVLNKRFIIDVAEEYLLTLKK
jgi:hypothetical protein